MTEYDLNRLSWELVKTKSATFHKAPLSPSPFKRKRRYAIKLAPNREFSAEQVDFDLTVELIVGTGVLAHHATIARILAYKPGLTLVVRAGEALTFKTVNEETIFVVSYQFP